MVKRFIPTLVNGGDDNQSFWLIYLLYSSTTPCICLVIPIWGDCDILLRIVTVFFPSGVVVSTTSFVIVVGYVQAANKTKVPIASSNFIFLIISTSFFNE